MAGCGGGDSGPTAKERAQQGCRDLADAFGNTCVRCNIGPYKDCYDLLLQAAVKGSCDNVVALRDENQFNNTCLPWMRSVSCAQITADMTMLDSSCSMQLEHN